MWSSYTKSDIAGNQYILINVNKKKWKRTCKKQEKRPDLSTIEIRGWGGYLG